MTSNQHGPYVQGYTRATMVRYKVLPRRKTELITKTNLSSDRRLQLAFVKLELLVTVYQQWYGEYVPGSCTHRPSSHER